MIDEDTRLRAGRILQTLHETLPIRVDEYAALVVARESEDPFRVLVVTILSQSCTDVNALRAYRRLDEEVGVSVEQLASGSARRIASAIRVAGLQRRKAKAIRELAQIVMKNFNGNLHAILEKPWKEAREILMELPKVGPKTADVLLSAWGKPTIPVDTHVDRVSKRLGLAPAKGRYEDVRGSLMSLFQEEDYGDVPLFLMKLGRTICKAPKPLCPICPVEKLCPYPDKTRER